MSDGVGGGGRRSAPDRIGVFTQTMLRVKGTELSNDLGDALFQISIDDLLEALSSDVFDNQGDTAAQCVGPKIRLNSRLIHRRWFQFKPIGLKLTRRRSDWVLREYWMTSSWSNQRERGRDTYTMFVASYIVMLIAHLDIAQPTWFNCVWWKRKRSVS